MQIEKRLYGFSIQPLFVGLRREETDTRVLPKDRSAYVVPLRFRNAASSFYRMGLSIGNVPAVIIRPSASAPETFVPPAGRFLCENGVILRIRYQTGRMETAYGARPFSQIGCSDKRQFQDAGETRPDQCRKPARRFGRRRVIARRCHRQLPIPAGLRSLC